MDLWASAIVQEMGYNLQSKIEKQTKEISEVRTSNNKA